MKALLISTDRELYERCKEVFADLPNSECQLHSGHFGSSEPDADLYIWDFQPGTEVPAELVGRAAHTHFFVLHRRHLDLFRERLPLTEINVLLRPLTQATLRAFLSQAFAVCTNHTINDAGAMRADRDEILQCLIEANLKIQEYDQERTNFLARAVHDFRAPLTALTGYCGLLARQLGPLSESQREVLERMQHSAKRLSRMTEAMFQLSIGKNPEALPTLQRHDIRECVDQALHEVLPYSTEKNISITLDLTSPADPLVFDRSQMEQVLINLLDNASKFTPRKGLIQIKGYPYFWERRSMTVNGMRHSDRRLKYNRCPNSYRVDIEDSGPGIPATRLGSIFEEYTTYSGGHDRSGGGLGLAICKHIMNQHNGSIWAANSTPQGTMFSLVLPTPALQATAKREQVALEMTSNGGSRG